MQSANVQKQFSLRAKTFNESANWINDYELIMAHVKMSEKKHPPRNGLELCCGTGIVGKSFVENGWNMIGVDLTKEMVLQANKFFPTIQGDIVNLPFEDNTFDLVVLRQALFLLDIKKALSEVKRVLKDNGSFVFSQTVPFSSEDEEVLRAIHSFKQEQMLQFYTRNDLEKELIKNGFIISETNFVQVRESITKWMNFAPEQSNGKKDTIHNMIIEAPDSYKKVRNVEIIDNELFENWNWIIFKVKKCARQGREFIDKQK